MKIQNISNIPMYGLKINKKFGLNVFEDFNFQTADKKNYRVSISKNEQMSALNVSFSDNGYKCAEQQSQIYPEIDFMFVDNMFTNRSDRGKGLGFGLHLTNIIEMTENKLNKIDLLSTESAIPFHVHFGFIPDQQDYGLLYVNLKSISDNSFPELAKFAQEARKIIKLGKIPEKIARGNELVHEYAKEIVKFMSKEDLKYAFAKETPMVLDKQNVLSNKNFYNKLFDKYKIDYQI